jgi:hypothetical protein
LTDELKEWEKQQLIQFDRVSSVLRRRVEQQNGQGQTLTCSFWKSQANDCDNSKSVQLPTLSTLIQLPATSVLSGIEHFLAELTCNPQFSHRTSMWLYSLMARLEPPLPDHMSSLLRDVSCVCSRVRAQFQPEAEMDKFRSMHLLISIVGRHFGQHDMTDDFRT